MEAYADIIVNEACIDCWAQHNIVDDDAGDDTDFVDPFPFPQVVRGQVMNPHMDFPATKQQQQQCKRPGPQDGMGANLRQPFGELGNNIRSGFKRSREAGEEEDELENELERRWRDRARNRDTVKGGAKIVELARKCKWGENQESELVVID